jgi:outer membrane protein
MKKLTLLTVFAMILSLGNLNAQKVKFGHINGNEVYRKMSEVKKADTIYSAYVAQLENQIKSMQEEYNKKVADYQANETTLSALMKETKLEEIKSLGERIQKFQVSAQEDAIKKQNEIYEPIRKKFNEALKNIAVKNGYRFIMDRSVLLYYDDADDVTAIVEKELGIK